MNQEKVTEISEGKQRSLANLKPFKKGVSGNPAGRPVGSISVIGNIKQMFEQDPERFQEFINAYLRDPHNRQHIVEMIDGRPAGSGTEVNIGDNRTIEISWSDTITEEKAVKYLEGLGYEVKK